MKYSRHKKINTIIYKRIDAILKKLNHRVHFRLYSITLDENNQADKIYRVKKTISIKANVRYSYVNDPLQEIGQVYSELGLPQQQEETISKDFFNQLIFQRKEGDTHSYTKQAHYVPKNSESEDETYLVTKEYIEDPNLLYTGDFRVSSREQEEAYYVVYLLDIRNLESDIVHTYYNKPDVSFIRMVLDYFFLDYFEEGTLELKQASDSSGLDKLNRKYQEDEVQFIRRINRLFFGKMQMTLQQGYDKSQHSKIVRSEYYINNLFENIDDISTQTYEGASPFGSMLFLNTLDIEAIQGPIKFVIQFKKEDLISIEDSKRIRKLLEMTNIKNHLYLISDGNWVYGVGKIEWDKLKETLNFRIDFKGISKYNLITINFEKSPSSIGELIVDGEKGVYRSNTDYEVTYQKLVTVAFKNPKIGEESYTSNKMEAILRDKFKDQSSTLSSEKISVLEQIVRKAREQRHGTMVVITDEDTAKEELINLRKQSTLIEPNEVHPDHIKFLTAIDGAIYFDTEARCYAIGVILDGVAQPELGDSSRGARFNSAYRYYSKLELSGKKCVIVIISEDGMIDVVPSFNDEMKILDLVEEIIDILDQREDSEREVLLQRKEEQLRSLRKTDFQPLLSLAQKFGLKENYYKASIYYDEAFELAGNTFIPAKHYSRRGICCYYLDQFLEATEYLEQAIAIDQRNDFRNISYTGKVYLDRAIKSKVSQDEKKVLLLKSLSFLEESINKQEFHLEKDINLSWEYNIKGNCYFQLTKITTIETEILKYFDESVLAFSKSLEWKPSVRGVYNNRARVFEKMGKELESVKDYIQGYFLATEAEDRTYNFKEIKRLMESYSDIVLDVGEFYRELVQNGQNQIYEELEGLISTLEFQMQQGLDVQESAFSSEQKKDI